MRLFELITTVNLFEGKKHVKQRANANEQFANEIEQWAKRNNLADYGIDDSDIDKIIDALYFQAWNIDPTANKKYSDWLAMQLIPGQIDGDNNLEVRRSLERFNQVGGFEKGKDINQYDTAELIAQALASISNNPTNKEIKRSAIAKAQSGKVRLIKMNTFSNLRKYTSAYGGTNWCIAATEEYFESYNCDYSGYLIIDPKYQTESSDNPNKMYNLISVVPQAPLMAEIRDRYQGDPTQEVDPNNEDIADTGRNIPMDMTKKYVNMFPELRSALMLSDDWFVYVQAGVFTIEEALGSMTSEQLVNGLLSVSTSVEMPNDMRIQYIKAVLDSDYEFTDWEHFKDIIGILNRLDRKELAQFKPELEQIIAKSVSQGADINMSIAISELLDKIYDDSAELNTFLTKLDGLLGKGPMMKILSELSYLRDSEIYIDSIINQMIQVGDGSGLAEYAMDVLHRPWNKKQDKHYDKIISAMNVDDDESVEMYVDQFHGGDYNAIRRQSNMGDATHS